METTFFRFSESEKNKQSVFNTSFSSLIVTSILFLVLVVGNSGSISQWMGYGDRINYIIYFGFILSFDAMAAIPFARLRQQNRPIRFVTIKLINIGLNIALNLFFILLCPYLITHFPESEFTKLISTIFNPDDLVGYIFISNLVASTITLILLLPEFRFNKFRFNTALLMRMLKYSWPLMIVAIAGSINLSIDKILLSMLLPGNSDAEIMSQVGIYGACYKVSIIMTLFVQTFRYAADPFFFAESGKSDSRQIYADVLKIFTIVTSLIFLITTLYLDFVITFIGEDYRTGRDVIPILLMGNLFLGIFYNLSFWYKLTNKTIYGALLSIIGAGITIILNIILIPKIGYYGSAWAAFFAYFIMMALSYFIGKKHFPVQYDIKKIVFYPGLAVLLFYVSTLLNLETGLVKYAINTMLAALYIIMIFAMEKRNFLQLLKS